jgi:valyl-tRNA synthetase
MSGDGATARTVPVIADEYVDRDFGTGALKITPGHDPNDYTLGKKHNLPIINIMNKDGTMNEKAGKYANLDRFVAREKIWTDMQEHGIAIKVCIPSHPTWDHSHRIVHTPNLSFI